MRLVLMKWSPEPWGFGLGASNQPLFINYGTDVTVSYATVMALDGVNTRVAIGKVSAGGTLRKRRPGRRGGRLSEPSNRECVRWKSSRRLLHTPGSF